MKSLYTHAALTLALLSAAGAAGAQEIPRLSLSVNVASWHTERWARHGLNQNNPGAGFAYQLGDAWAVAGGAYFNSYRRWTTYALAQWTPLRADVHGWQLKAGAAAGLATGYRRGEVPTAPLIGAALFQLITPRGFSASVYATPNTGARASGFLGLQFGVPLH